METTSFQHVMIGAVHNIVKNYASRHCATISMAQADKFFQMLQLEAFQKPEEIVFEVTFLMIFHTHNIL
jgi:hypothetical protein